MEMNGTTVIARPVETVFAYVSNVSNDVHWRTGVTESGLESGHSLGADITPSGVYRLLGPLFAWMGCRRNQADVEKLRDIVESTLSLHFLRCPSNGAAVAAQQPSGCANQGSVGSTGDIG